MLSVGSLKQRFIFFGRNSGIHGLHYVFQEHAAFLGRIFWLVILAASAGCLYLLLAPVIELDGGITFTPDTVYLDWTTTFPAVTVCEVTSTKIALRKLAELYPDLVRSLAYNHQRYLADLLYGRGTCSQMLCAECGVLVPCDVKWREVMDNIHKKCQQLLTDCSYNGINFSCCDVFHSVDSEQGPCFAVNTLQSAEHTRQPLFTVNRTSGPGVLTFRLLADSQISLHSSEELATNSLSGEYQFPITVDRENQVEIMFSMVEMKNDPLLMDVDIEERNCRFLHEVPADRFHNYPVYSYGACKLAKSTNSSFHRCGCISPIRSLSYQKYYCNYTGLNCIAQYEAEKKMGLEKDVEEDCLPSCEEDELFIIDSSGKWAPEVAGKGSLVEIRMAALPTLRYQRNLLRTNLDFVVTVGGMAGLFFSASVLSVAEIFYLILRKPRMI